MPWGLLLNPLSRGEAGKKKKGSKMAKKKRKRAAKTKRRVTKKRKTAVKRKATKRKAPKRRATAKRKPAKRRTTVKKARKKAVRRIAKGKTKRKKLTPFFTFMMAMPGKQSVAKAKKAGAKWRKMTDKQKAKYGKILTSAQRKAAKKSSRKRYKTKKKATRRKSASYRTWKAKRGKGWKSAWKKGMKRSVKSKSYVSALMEGVGRLNPFKSTRKRRVHRKGNPLAKKRKKSRRKAGKKRRKSTKRKYNPMRKYSRKRKRKSSRRRRRNPMNITASLKGMTTKSALKQYGYVTAGVVAGAVAPNLIAKAMNRVLPSVNIDTPIARAGIGVVGSLLAGALAGSLTKSRDKGMLVAAGGIASVIGALAIDQINRYLPGVAGFGGMGYLGATDDEVRAVVETEIRKELGLSGGLSQYVTQEALEGGMGDYVTAPKVEAAGTAAGLGLETADDIDEVDTFEGGSF